MFRLRHVPLVFRALARWVFGTRAGLKVVAVVASVAGLLSLLGSEEGAVRSGKWTGFANHVAPHSGLFTFEATPGKPGTCTVRGQTSHTSGDGWVFKGDARLAETACKARVEQSGRVSGRVDVKLEWRGRSKGIGGDWEDIDGYGLCEGELEGTLTAGGKWTGLCKNEGHTWVATFDWKLD